MTKEQFGTDTAVYQKLAYNSRGQLAETRASTSYTGPTDDDGNRGQFINYYSPGCGGALCNNSDNNGNLRGQDTFIALDEQGSSTSWYQQFEYDNLNRLQFMQEGGLRQEYVYDRWGNRTIHQGNTWGGAPKPNFVVDANHNRLTAPAGYTMSYDDAGNLTTDTYTGAGNRTYDAENRMTSAGSAGILPASYTYNADGQRVRRKVDNTETWQVYGFDGELLAEYTQNASPLSPTKEYGYRNGQLLVTATGAAGGGWGSPPVFDDNPLNPNYVGETTVQSRHITQLRTAINALRSHHAFAPDPWLHSATTNDWISANPIVEMRTALDDALDEPSGGYSAGLGLGLPIKAIHIQELRDRVLTAWNSGSGGIDIRWLVSDQLGTPRIILDKTGALATVKRHDYLPFGEELTTQGLRNTMPGYSGDNIRQKFTLKERDSETGLDYFLARYYSNTQGRFTSVDPEQAGARSDDPQSWNGYAYARNSPLVYTDPLGRDYRVCDPSGKECVTYTDKEFDKFKSGGPRDGYTFKDHNIYYNGELTATYSNDCLSCEGLINGMAQRGPAVEKLTGGFFAAAVILGTTGGAGAYVLGTGATVTTLGIASRAAPAVGAAGTVLSQLGPKDASIIEKTLEFGGSATNTFLSNVDALTRATQNINSSWQVYRIGQIGNSPIFGGKSGVGIAEVDGITVIVKMVHGSPQILGPLGQ